MSFITKTMLQAASNTGGGGVPVEPVAFVGLESTSGVGVQSNITLDISTIATQPGDLVLVAFTTSVTNSGPISYRISGYTQLADHSYSDVGQGVQIQLGYKFYTGAADDTITILGGNGDVLQGWGVIAHVFRNVDTSVIDVPVETSTSIQTYQPTPPPITPVTSGAAVYIIGAAGHGAGSFFYGVPNAFNIRSITANDSFDVSASAARMLWTSGTVTPSTFIGGGSDSTAYNSIGLTVALKPAGAGGGATGWVLEHDTPFGDVARGIDVDSSGNVYISYNGDTNNNNPFWGVTKLDSSGSVLWNSDFENSAAGPVTGGPITIDSNGDIIAVGTRDNSGGAGTSYDYRAAKLSSTNGSIVWQRNIVTVTFSSGQLISVDSSDNIYVGGITFGSFFVGEGELYKLNSSGVLQWGRNIGEDGPSGIISLGNIIPHSDGTIRALVSDPGAIIYTFNSTTGNFVSSQFYPITLRLRMDIDSSDNQYFAGIATQLGNRFLYVMKKPADSTTSTWRFRTTTEFAPTTEGYSYVQYDEANDTLYVLAISVDDPMTLFSIDGTSGAVNWQKTIDGSGTNRIRGSTDMKYSNGFLYVASYFDLGDGGTIDDFAVFIKFPADGNVSDGTYGPITVTTETFAFEAVTLGDWDAPGPSPLAAPSRTTNTTADSVSSQSITTTLTGLV